MPELWQPIEGYEGLYEVSDQGKVRNRKGLVLKPGVLKRGKGYLIVCLCNKGTRSMKYVHRLVAAAFVPGDAALTVNHKDGNTRNNTADNLEWMTQQEQMTHAHEIKTV